MRRLPPLLLALIAAAAAADDGGLAASIEALPKRYRLVVRDADGDERRSLGWADGIGLRLRWTPPQAAGDWIIAIDAGADARRDRDQRQRTVDLGLAVARIVAAVGRSRLLAVGRYGVGGILVDDDGDRAVERAWGAITGVTLGVEGWCALGSGAEAGLVIGYEGRWVRDVWGVADVAGTIHGPVAALALGWRW